MVQAIHDDTPITDAQKELLQVSSVPLYKILTVQAAYGRGMPTDDRQTLAEIASVEYGRKRDLDGSAAPGFEAGVTVEAAG